MISINKIEEAVEKLEKEYEYFKKTGKNYEAVKNFIGFLQKLEESFLEEGGKTWTEKEAGEKIAKWKIDYLKSTVKESAEALDMVYNDFKGLFQLDGNPYEDSEKLLAHYRGCEVCEQLIMYLRNVFSILVELEKEKIAPDKAKDKIYLLEIENFSGSGNIEKSDLERIYREFKTLIEGR